ncbi:MAG: transglutaminase domain-containing protein [Coriobacteriia bacterium]|nr:transglutaminase domain-containing protein [Coriobacteriia bacterium]
MERVGRKHCTNDLGAFRAAARNSAQQRRLHTAGLLAFCLLLAVLAVAFPPGAPARAEALTVSVSYQAPQCGTPTAFTVDATGGSGTYQYMLQCVYAVEADGTQTLVTDPSASAFWANPSQCPYGVYKATNTFEFTFWTSGTYRVYFYALDQGSSPITYKRQVETITINDPAHPSTATLAANIAAECAAAGCETSYEKALWLHDWVIDHCTYDNTHLYCGAEGALARGTGTCEAYHRAYALLLNTAGVENGRMEGNGHVWTAVNMDGAWYQVDTTWDDPGYTSTVADVQHLYFGLTDAIMLLVHSDHTPQAGYESNALACNYFIRSGEIAPFTALYTENVQAQLDAGATAFTLPSALTGEAAAYARVLNNLVAYQLENTAWTARGAACTISAAYDAASAQFSFTAFAGVKGDVNGNGVLNVVDAQMAYDMACGVYAPADLPESAWAAANVDGEAGVTANDARAIQHAIHHGWPA